MHIIFVKRIDLLSNVLETKEGRKEGREGSREGRRKIERKNSLDNSLIKSRPGNSQAIRVENSNQRQPKPPSIVSTNDILCPS